MMPTYDLYSTRRKRELGKIPDVYTYDALPQAFRTQVIHIWGDAIGIPYHSGEYNTDRIQAAYLSIAKFLRREFGVTTLISSNYEPESKRKAEEELQKWLLSEKDIEKVLDGIEASFL